MPRSKPSSTTYSATASADDGGARPAAASRRTGKSRRIHAGGSRPSSACARAPATAAGWAALPAAARGECRASGPCRSAGGCTRCPWRTPRSTRPRTARARWPPRRRCTGRGGIGGAQDAVRDPGLAAGLGGLPAGQNGDEARAARRASRAAGTSARSNSRLRHHSQAPISPSAISDQADADHDAGRRRRPARPAGARRGGKSLRPANAPVPVSGSGQARQVRDGDLGAVASRRARRASRTAPGPPARRLSQCASMAAIFAGWYCRVLRPCWSPSSSCSGRQDRHHAEAHAHHGPRLGLDAARRAGSARRPRAPRRTSSGRRRIIMCAKR